MVGSTQSPIGTSGPVYGYKVSTTGAGTAFVAVDSAPSTNSAVVVLIVDVESDSDAKRKDWVKRSQVAMRVYSIEKTARATEKSQ